MYNNILSAKIPEGSELIGVKFDDEILTKDEALTLSNARGKHVIHIKHNLNKYSQYTNIPIILADWSEFVGELKYILLTEGYEGFLHPSDRSFLRKWFGY